MQKRQNTSGNWGTTDCSLQISHKIQERYLFEIGYSSPNKQTLLDDRFLIYNIHCVVDFMNQYLLKLSKPASHRPKSHQMSVTAYFEVQILNFSVLSSPYRNLELILEVCRDLRR